MLGFLRISLAASTTLFTPFVAPVAAELDASLRNERIDSFLLESMRAGDLDAWVILTREGNMDPLSGDFGFHLGTGALIFLDRGGPRAERLALVSSLDLVPLRESGIYDRVHTFERDQRFEDELAKLLKDIDAERIGVNMSDAVGVADGLSASFHRLLKNALGPDKAGRLVSAERAILSFRSKKLPAEIQLYRKAVAVTREILHETFTGGFIRPGVTTRKDVRDHVHELAARRGYSETAWEREGCPGVYSGLFRDLSHASPDEQVIEPGDILWVDFGIRFHGYTTDMIRAGYLLRPGETEPPPEVQRMFDTSKAANRAAVAAMRPGAAGYEVDAAARKVVTDAGYPEFFHATGHPVGIEVHGAGPRLGPKGPKYGSAVDLRLEAGQIFAIEPSVMLPKEELGGSWIVNIEEEVLVTEDGAVYLSPPQEELYLLPAPNS